MVRQKLRDIKHKLQDYWRSMTTNKESTKMSRGAYFITKIKSWAHGESWRKSHGHHPDKKKHNNRGS